jgi:hypothetical protein
MKHAHRHLRDLLRSLMVAWFGVAPLALAAQGDAANAAPTILSLQPTRSSSHVALRGEIGATGDIELVPLSPANNAWWLLNLRPPGSLQVLSYHLENADPLRQQLALDTQVPGRVLMAQGRSITPCVLWPDSLLAQAARVRSAYAPLCEGRLLLRNAVPGHRSTLEAATEFLRDHVWGGEQIVNFVKREFYRDAFAERVGAANAPAAARGYASPLDAPPDALPGGAKMAGADAARVVRAPGLGIALAANRADLLPGRWYTAAGLEGVFVSVALPPSAALTDRSDAIESEALNLFVAFDLAAFDLGFMLGTEHPRLGWASRLRDEQRDSRLPGPDGINNAAPLVRTGMLAPTLLPRVVATFTGGFKREHGAFHAGALASVNHGSHYGFIEQGVVFSRLQPGLATLLVGSDGHVDMKTWQQDDNNDINRLRHARQNGVPLIEPGADGRPAIGQWVTRWADGNWSGSAEGQQRTLRAGACLIESAGRRFLVYGYFSTATPLTMAHSFQAYGCRYAMHLDMNALEHTYLALYPAAGAQRDVQHLVTGMAVLDKQRGARLLPRFLAFADDRDFFYLIRRVDRP